MRMFRNRANVYIESWEETAKLLTPVSVIMFSHVIASSNIIAFYLNYAVEASGVSTLLMCTQLTGR